MTKLIRGLKDPTIKELRALATRDGRNTHERYIIDGARLVWRTLVEKSPLAYVILNKRFAESEGGADLRARAKDACVPVYVATEGVIARAAGARPVPD